MTPRWDVDPPQLSRDISGTLTALLLAVALAAGFVGLLLLGQDAMCEWHGPDSEISYCRDEPSAARP